MTDAQPLAPCPFCGGTPHASQFQRRYNFNFAVECDCGACISSECGSKWESTDEASTIKAWNRRVEKEAQPPLGAALEIDRLKQELAASILQTNNALDDLKTARQRADWAKAELAAARAKAADESAFDLKQLNETHEYLARVAEERDAALAKLAEMTEERDEATAGWHAAKESVEGIRNRLNAKIDSKQDAAGLRAAVKLPQGWVPMPFPGAVGNVGMERYVGMDGKWLDKDEVIAALKAANVDLLL